jgi:hypothetical protein
LALKQAWALLEQQALELLEQELGLLESVRGAV